MSTKVYVSCSKLLRHTGGVSPSFCRWLLFIV